MGQYKDVPRDRGWLDDEYHDPADGEGEPVYEDFEKGKTMKLGGFLGPCFEAIPCLACKGTGNKVAL